MLFRSENAEVVRQCTDPSGFGMSTWPRCGSIRSSSAPGKSVLVIRHKDLVPLVFCLMTERHLTAPCRHQLGELGLLKDWGLRLAMLVECGQQRFDLRPQCTPTISRELQRRASWRKRGNPSRSTPTSSSLVTSSTRSPKSRPRSACDQTLAEIIHITQA